MIQWLNEARRPRDTPASYVEAWKPDGTVLARSPLLGERDLVAAPTTTIDQLVFSDVTLPDGRAGRAITVRFMPHDESHDAKAESLVVTLAAGTSGATFYFSDPATGSPSVVAAAIAMTSVVQVETVN